MVEASRHSDVGGAQLASRVLLALLPFQPLHGKARNPWACNRSGPFCETLNRDSFQNQRFSQFAGAVLAVHRRSCRTFRLLAADGWQPTPTLPAVRRGPALPGSAPSGRAFFPRRETAQSTNRLAFDIVG